MNEAAHTVFVLGAGASRAEATARRPKRPKDHPPLDATFFHDAATRDDEHGLLAKVVKQAARLGEHDLTAEDPAVSLESHLGRLYFEMNHNPLRTSTQAYFDAVRLYASEILTTTNWMMGKSGLIFRMVQKELKAKRRISIVTFDIDLLAENALNRLRNSRPSADWCLNHAYGFQAPKKIVSYPSADKLGEFPQGSRAEIVVFKMHGSVNWVFRHRDANPPADLTNRDYEFYIVGNERLPRGRSTILTGTGKGRKRWYISPLIVPPVYEKHSFIKRHLQDVWDGASDALKSADRVIFWGYSFPQADTHARHYFQGLSDANAALKRPITINPDPDAETALWRVLRPRSVDHYGGAEDYLADDQL